ncbi:helix-turn-helix domain-containing protein [Marinisporobacter balticus]|uniref:AraC-like DNA-binding protein n=1 Tax=Marinisporobacter balticus TaxID=2018667 RepID=A0A4R2K4Y6_9FIRM|nr:response regulator transcription factor [Marinisporobacter balticus]TCO68271.1 AraC-like DNA-binding protein [Marinisporobacter balticus]
MNKQLFLADTQNQLSFDDMIEKIENIDNRIIYHYNKNYMYGKTIQYEMFKGIWIVYHDLALKRSDLFPLEVNGFIQINYCISGRCELHYKNNKVFYVGAGDFVVGLLKNKQYKHSFPLGNYNGISIITTEEKLDNFLKTIFPETKITSKKLLLKIEECDEYIVLSNNLEIKNIMEEIILSNHDFWKEKAVIKFAELILLLISNDIEFYQLTGKYYDKQLINKVKQIKQEVTANIEVYTKIEEIAQKYHISSKTFADCFKAVYRKTYYAFIKEFRVKKASELLRSENLTIGEVAIRVGYLNASKFSKAFLDIMGVTPICFRKNNSLTVLD